MQLVIWDGFSIIIQKIYSKDNSDSQRVSLHGIAVKHDSDVIVD